ncbi:acyltransferase family protein [Flavobacterium sedimenticola]|uniref:Acyltransferase family protein n=1 Tax=Flavobacterium sedimenticola TaxID=3043286 RepID=A0ABT6XSV1_9FLAO|nr:acyltransferase family protein [Flavobacterium sedimenticola]MDI9258173.1 acyltransferase family protein [Flavobacterium sedimenticola]
MENKARINYIDNNKIAITFLVVAHHAGQAYGNTGGVWLLEDSPKLEWLSSFFFINAAYMMGFFFFVSGYFMYFSVSRKSTAVFLKDRFRRLGIISAAGLTYFLKKNRTINTIV